MVAAVPDQVADQRPQRITTEAPAVPRRAQEHVDPGVAIVGVRLLGVLDVADHVVPGEDRERRVLRGVVQLVDQALRAVLVPSQRSATSGSASISRIRSRSPASSGRSATCSPRIDGVGSIARQDAIPDRT